MILSNEPGFYKKNDFGIRIENLVYVKKIQNKLFFEKKELKNNPNKGIIEKIQNAKWLLRSVKKRNETVQKVGEYICSKQIAFFENNPLKINTLSNKEIADEIGVHPSTVSRILRNKYIDTPKGIMPMKSLLMSSVSKTRDISSTCLLYTSPSPRDRG